MVITLINKHMSILDEAQTKGISLEIFSEIPPALRNNISKINKKVDLKSQAWKRVLYSIELINFINHSKAENSLLNDLLLSNNKRIELEICSKFDLLEQVYKGIKELHLKAEKEGAKAFYSHKVHLYDVFSDIVLYFIKYGYDEKKLESVYGEIRDIKKSHMAKAYKELGSQRIEFLHFLSFNYSKFIEGNNNKFKQFEESKEDAQLYEKLFSVVGEDYFQVIYFPINMMLKRSQRKEQIKEALFEFLEKFNSSLITKWVLELIPHKTSCVTEFEIKQLARNASLSNSDVEVLAIIYGKDSLNYQALSIYKDGCYNSVQKLIKSAITEKKKAFLKLAIEHFNILKGFNSYNILFSTDFRKIVNINTMNAKNLKLLSDMNNTNNLGSLRKNVELTFQELHFLYSKTDLTRNVFYNLMELSVDERLKVMRQLPELQEVQSLLIQDEKELVQRITQLIAVKPLKTWISEKNIRLTDAQDTHYLMVLLAPDKFERFSSELKRGNDVDFILKNEKIIEVARTLDEAKAMFLLEDKKCQYMIKKIGLSPDFITSNKSRIISFCERNLTQVFWKMHERKILSEEQAHNLNLITKAELMGKLEEIKFADADFELEIGLPITDKSKTEWKINREKLIGSFNIQEAYDYETTIRVGENPVETCMDWNDGLYSRCLLSNFDTNKKVMVARDAKGRVVSRAIMRLTKGSDQPISRKPLSPKRLSFKDIENPAEETGNSHSLVKKEELVLFLERCYSSLDNKQCKKVDKEFMKLAKLKAEKLGAKLIISDSYEEALDGLVKEESYYIFISYSKNGHQYLDSLSGQATDSNAGEYKNAAVLVEVERELAEVV